MSSFSLGSLSLGLKYTDNAGTEKSDWIRFLQENWSLIKLSDG